VDTVGPLPLNDISGNELIERRQAPAFDVGIVLEQAWRTFAAGKSGEMRVPVWSLRELLLRGQLDSAAPARTTSTEKTVISDVEVLAHTGG